MKVTLSERAVQILFTATSAYQSEASCSQGDGAIPVRAATEQYAPLGLLIQVCQE